MKKLTLTLLGIGMFTSLSYSQIYLPNTQSTSGSNTTVLGASYSGTDAVTVINSANSTTSGRKALELRYSVGDLFNYPPTQPVFIINEKKNAIPYGVHEAFSIHTGGQTFMGTTSGNSKLNIGGGIEGFGGRMDYTLSAYDMEFTWKAKTALPDYQRFTFNYAGDGTHTAKEIFSLHKEGKMAVGDNITSADALLHVEGAGNDPATDVLKVKSGAGALFNISELGDVVIERKNVPNSGSHNTYGLKIKNDGWQADDFALEVETAHNRVFSVSNAGVVFIGQDMQADRGTGDYYSLYVKDGIRTERVRVDLADENGWADYVFEEDYKLMSLSEVEAYIAENGHLPNVPSAEKVTEEGIDLAEMNKILLEKVEELTLHVIALEKKLSNIE